MNRSKGYAGQPAVWLFVIVGGILLFGGAYAYLNTLLFLAKAKKAQGVVIEVVQKVSPDGFVLYAPKVLFWEETKERRFEFIGSSRSAYKEDQKIAVFYNPENPENAKIGDFEHLFVGPTIAFLPGGFIFVTGLLLMRARRKIIRQKK